MRLQKFLSDAGVASRRRAEELVSEGRVLVNDQVVESLPAFVDPRNDVVIVDGVRVRTQRHEYWLLHKPRNVVCTNSDPSGRTRVVDLLPPGRARMFSVGRLDAESTGLLLMTNDGELAERLTHPRFGVPKVYRAEVRSFVPDEIPGVLRDGVHLAEGKARAAGVQIVHRSRDHSVLEITLRESRNRQVRRMLAKLGFPVWRLKRVQYGPLVLKGLPLGACRELSAAELGALRREADQAVQRAAARGPRRGGRPAARFERDTGKPRAAGSGKRRTVSRQKRDGADEGAPPRRRIVD